ncbi:hypothetical protein C1H76_8842 [Elsinoe australis]|uniref:Uncharacterized protein n=1 Tax=Elsinoe australis TaxID=40998 RepID=A0A2P7ZCZ2_9PEZI|nr:hypothetical protein B9Z65_5063 [Elsinoe australis]TKX18953.1 hypothetical protein C1H76_8842 [Elsinoe australis]
MDSIKKAMGKPAGSGSTPVDPNKEDYGDKGLDAIEKKAGQDPSKLRQVNEKVTDTARGMFEKSSGKKVPEKFSN